MKKLNEISTLIFISLVLFNCNSKKFENTNNGKEHQIEFSETINTNRIFKEWLKDTLLSFKNWANVIRGSAIKKEIEVAPDSSSLKTYTSYEAFVDFKEKQDKEILNIIDLLKEYNEVPNVKFKLTFKYYTFYQPTPIEDLRYDYTFEVLDIVAAANNMISKYGYIRGRLSGKETIWINNNGQKKIKHTDFIWQGDSLKKVELR